MRGHRSPPSWLEGNLGWRRDREGGVPGAAVKPGRLELEMARRADPTSSDLRLPGAAGPVCGGSPGPDSGDWAGRGGARGAAGGSRRQASSVQGARRGAQRGRPPLRPTLCGPGCTLSGSLRHVPLAAAHTDDTSHPSHFPYTASEQTGY